MKNRWIAGSVAVLFMLGGCHAAPTELPGEESAIPEENETSLPTEAPSEIPLSGLSNECRGWGFRRLPVGRPEFTAQQKEEMETYHCLYMGEKDEKRLYLTFDEGYENGYTPQILDTLQKTGTPAAFFITGAYLEREPELVDRMVAEGHTVGNHSLNHPSLPTLDDEAAAKEITELENRFFAQTGRHMTYFRPPRGEYSPRTLALADNLGYTNVFWSLAYLDWDTEKQRGEEYAYREVMKNLHPGCVILLHAVSRDNAAALERIICDAKSEGYEFYPLDEYR